MAQDNSATVYEDYDELYRSVKHLKEEDKYEFFDKGIFYGASGAELNETLKLEGYDGPALESVEFFLKTENLEVLDEKKGISGFGLGAALAVTYQDKIEAVKAFRHLYYGFDDILMHCTEINIDELSENEAAFSKDKAKGHIVINIDLSDIETRAFEDYKNLDDIVKMFECEPIREEAGKRYTFTKDPDGLPIELCEESEKEKELLSRQNI